MCLSGYKMMVFNLFLELHKSIYDCSFCVKRHAKKALLFTAYVSTLHGNVLYRMLQAETQNMVTVKLPKSLGMISYKMIMTYFYDSIKLSIFWS